MSFSPNAELVEIKLPGINKLGKFAIHAKYIIPKKNCRETQ